jgi:hypothetical protein
MASYALRRLSGLRSILPLALSILGNTLGFEKPFGDPARMLFSPRYLGIASSRSVRGHFNSPLRT